MFDIAEAHYDKSQQEKKFKKEIIIHGKPTFLITDNRTNRKFELPIENCTIRAHDLSMIRDRFGKVTRPYDPGYHNTASCYSKISYIDSRKGLL